jgi:hypothetical protein
MNLEILAAMYNKWGLLQYQQYMSTISMQVYLFLSIFWPPVFPLREADFVWARKA